MSHFTVLVIGDDVETQLAKYNENNETEPRVDCEVSDEEKERFLEYYKENENFEGTFDECYEEHGEDWNNSSWKKSSKGIWQEWSTYNPDSKWDWYSVGGRWTGYFKLKKDATGELGEVGAFGNAPKKGYTDSLLKRDFDIEGQKNGARERAIKHYNLLESCFPNGFPVITLKWEDLIDENNAEYKDIPIDEKRNMYHNQPALKNDIDKDKLSKKQKEVFGWFDLNDYQCTVKEYGQRAYDNAIATYAMVIDGEWFEKGEMGWFGMSHGDMEQPKWNEIINKAIDEIEDDVTLTLLDCHI